MWMLRLAQSVSLDNKWGGDNHIHRKTLRVVGLAWSTSSQLNVQLLIVFIYLLLSIHYLNRKAYLVKQASLPCSWATLTDISLPGKPRLQRELMETSEKSIDPSAECIWKLPLVTLVTNVLNIEHQRQNRKKKKGVVVGNWIVLGDPFAQKQNGYARVIMAVFLSLSSSFALGFCYII